MQFSIPIKVSILDDAKTMIKQLMKAVWLQAGD